MNSEEIETQQEFSMSSILSFRNIRGLAVLAVLFGTFHVLASSKDSSAGIKVFSRDHLVQSVENESLINQTDILKITSDGNGQAFFVFKLYFDGESSCSMSGFARTTKEGLDYTEYVRPVGETKDLECHLQIKAVGDNVVLHDTDDNCQSVYCGRGTIEGATLQKQ
jgi:hypothetical protein